MKSHNCLIGLYYHSDDSEFVTVERLQALIEDTKEYNNMLHRDSLLCGAKDLYKKEYTLKDYADKRKSTNLTRFNYCPICGNKISWNTLKELDNGKV